MNVQLLDKTRKLTKMLHNANSGSISFSEISHVLSGVLDSEIVILKENGKILSKCLSEQAVSLRESSSSELIEPLCSCKVHTDVDPTFLYDASFWGPYANAPAVEEPYIFVYMLRPEPLTMQLAKALSVKTGLPIYLISNRIISDEAVRNVTDAGIEEFLSYIKNAAYVVTNSFHGTAFSVQFHKPFLSVAIAGSGMRVRDFLGELGLSDRIASDTAGIEKIGQECGMNDANYFSRILRKQKELHLGNIEKCGKCKNFSSGRSLTFVLRYYLKREWFYGITR